MVLIKYYRKLSLKSWDKQEWLHSIAPQKCTVGTNVSGLLRATNSEDRDSRLRENQAELPVLAVGVCQIVGIFFRRITAGIFSRFTK